jgi:uncharacterized protein (TIGR03000 family)
MIRRWIPAAGAVALLLGSAGTSSAQVFFLPFGLGNPVFGSGGFGYGGWGYYPGGIGYNYLPRSYGAFTGYGPIPTGVTTFATFPASTGYNAPVALQGGYVPAAPLWSTSYVAFAGRGTGGLAPVGYQETSAPATVVAEVPADARLWFDGHPTTQTGTERTFTTPPLEPGRDYHYDVRARWTQDGKTVEQSQRVRVFSGARMAVSFPKP